MLISLTAWVAAAASLLPGTPQTDVRQDKIDKITKAMPEKPPAKPAKARKMLIYSTCAGFYHKAIPVGEKAFEIMGKKTGAVEVVVSDDLANFEADTLKTFDVVLLNNNTGELFMKKKGGSKEKAAELRKNLLDWLKNGGGLVGVHAATDTRNCDDFNEVIGGKFSGHPWHAPVPIKNDDPSNPINASFGGKGFVVTDEIYQFNKGHYSREKQRVLLSLDRKAMDASDNAKLKKNGSRKDNDYAVSWVKEVGKGRVFYCSLGHRDEIFWNTAVLGHYLAGIQWAAGDLKDVNATPNP
jgi:type 1 glutamine amidotransferase